MKFNYYKFALVSVFFAIIVGALYSAPQFFIKQNIEKIGNEFVVNQFIRLDDGGDAYFQFSRHVAEGNFPPGDLFSENKLSNIYPWLPPAFLAVFIKIFNGNVSIAYLVANFVFPAILFLFFCAIGLIIFKKDQLWSFFFGLVGILTPISLLVDTAFFSINNFSNVFAKNFYPMVQTYLPTLFFSRVDYPLLTHLIYFPAIIFLFLFWFKPKISMALLAGFFGGLLFYVYFYKWIYWVIVLGILFLYIILFNRKDIHRIKKFIVLLLVMFITSIPYFINYFKLNNLQGSSDFIQRLSLEVGRSINLFAWPSYIVYLVLAVLVYFVFYKKYQLKAILYWSFILAAFVVWNIQIIIGYVPHSDHWPRAINPLLFIIIFDIAFNFYKITIEYRIRLKTFFSIAIVFLMILLVTKKTVNAVGFFISDGYLLQKYTLQSDIVNSYRWIDQNYNNVSVISPSFVTSIYLAGFSSARPFLPWGGVTPISNFDLENLFLKSNKLFGISTEILEKRLRDGNGIECKNGCGLPYISENIKGTRFFLYQLYFTENKKNGVRDIPEDKISELLTRYKKLDISWKDSGADLVYFGPLEKEFSSINMQNNNDLKLVFSDGSIEIYKIKK